MRIVVTGATGNVGSALVRRLGEDSAVDSVVGLARRRPDMTVPKVGWEQADVATDDLLRHFEGADVVIHLAWLFQPTHNPRVTWDNNVLGSARVLDAVARAGVPRLVVASSVGAYSPCGDDIRVDESWPTNGWSEAAYTREKSYVERLLDTFELQYPGCRVVRMRPAFTFQESSATQQRRLFAGPLVPGSWVRRQFIPALPSPAGLRFQALHTDDAAEAYRLGALRDVSGAFNLAAEPVVTAADIAGLLDARTFRVPSSAVRELINVAWSAHVVPASPHLFDAVMRLPLLSSRRAREELGWSPTVNGVQALAAFLSGLQRGAGAPTPPLDPATSGRLRSHEFATGVGSRP